jgi:hypothetical protein
VKLIILNVPKKENPMTRGDTEGTLLMIIKKGLNYGHSSGVFINDYKEGTLLMIIKKGLY